MTLPRFQFSLRTLALAALLLGSAGMLWWNWEPWSIAFVVYEPAPIEDLVVSDDDRFIYIRYGKDANQHVDMRRLPSGERHALLDVPANGGIRATGRYIVTHKFRTFPDGDLQITDAESLKPLGQEDIVNITCSVFPDYVACPQRKDKKETIYKLPDFKPVATIDEIEMTPGHTNALDRMAMYRHGRLEIVSFETGKSIQTEKVDAKLVGVVFSSKTMMGFEMRNNDTPGMAYIFSLADGRLLMKYPYHDPNLAFSKDGTRCMKDTPAGLELRDVFTDQVIATLKLPLSSPGVFSPDGALWLDIQQHGIYDARTLAPLWTASAPAREEFSPNSELLRTGLPWRIHEARTGTPRLDFSSMRWREFSKQMKCEFLHASNDFLIMPDTQRLAYFHQRRPFPWYGIACLWEFWLVVVLSSAFLWSLLKDRAHRRLSRRESTPFQ